MERTATKGLLWLLRASPKRGRRCTPLAMTKSQSDKSAELNISFTKAKPTKSHSNSPNLLFSCHYSLWPESRTLNVLPLTKKKKKKLGYPLDLVQKELQA
ncbi:hypothetical protein T439DRAFT_151838 [Meredithblackwellia eburnea MCA 4105]